MKVWIVILVLVFLFIFVACKRQNEAERAGGEGIKKEEVKTPIAETVDHKISGAMDRFSEGRVAEGANLLLDVVLIAKPRDQMPEGFESSILAAKDQFNEGNIEKGVKVVSEALLQVRAEAEPQEEAEKGQISNIAEIFKNRILMAKEQFREGNADKGMILILESIQFIAPRTD